jgi:signal transduction histidine kinase
MTDTGFGNSPVDPRSILSKESKECLGDKAIFYYRAIENADGVPFQLIFGPHIGEGYYLSIGSGIKNLTGISPEAFTESLFYGMIEETVPLSGDLPDDPAQLREKIIRGEVRGYKAELLIRTPGGERKWILDSSLPLTDEETGKVTGTFGILFDIDERKQILNNLERARNQSEESDRLKTAFLRNLSHEIRTPLNAIVGFSTLIGEQENDPQRRQEFIDIITRNADHLLEIVTDIVEISDIEANTVKVNRSEINLNQLLQRVYERFRTKAYEKNLSLSLVAPADDEEVTIVTDRFKLLQVLLNLVGNAIKFTSEGKVEFGYTIKGGMLEFYTSDTGIGISPEYHSRVFSSFFQEDYATTRTYEGTGLGLSISKAYVELLGGNIWFTSQPGEGSVFYFTLPYERIGT